MRINDVPFLNYCGLVESPPGNGYLLELPAGEFLLNHVQTVAATAQLTLAEATSGWVLLRQLGEITGFVSIVRRLEAKFSKAARGHLYAKGTLQDEPSTLISKLQTKGRLLVPVEVTVHDQTGDVTLSTSVEWFISRAEKLTQ